eukprot:gene12890-14216_t
MISISLQVALLLFVNALLKATDAAKVLKMAHVLYRHGDRTPVSTFPTDKYQESFWPDGFGRLTQRGMRMEYELGKFFRKRYVEDTKLVNSFYLHKEVYCRSSDQERCLMSAESQLAALYPPKGWQVWNKNISWQPVPVHTVPGNKDQVLRPWDANCPRLKTLIEMKRKSPEYVKISQEKKALLDYVSKNSGLTVTVANLWKVSDALYVEKCHNLKLPDWVTNDTWNELEYMSSWTWKNLFTGNDEFSRLSGGSLIKWITTRMDAIRKKTSGTFKLNIYSAHDTTIAALLGSLGIFNQPTIPYASSPIIELYENTPGQFTVEMYYRNTTARAPYPLRLPGCDFSCPLDKFISLLKNRVPTNYSKECGVTNPKQKTKIKKDMAVIIGLAIVCGLMFLMLVALLIQQCREKEGHKNSLYTQASPYISEDERDLDGNLQNA